MTIHCGIDPGVTGGFAFLDTVKSTLWVYDTPSLTISTGGKEKTRVNIDGVVELLLHHDPDDALVEKVHSTPNDGHVGAFVFGKATGLVIGAIAGIGITFDEVTPGKWKKDLRVPADKAEAMNVASRLFPHCKSRWSLKKNHGRAEAALIALYRAISNGFQPTQPIKLGEHHGSWS
jgi:crossover junction endodeoxyribonuclease RuvC